MKFIWTLRAELTFQAEQDFIFRKWNEQEVIKFVKLVYNNIERLKVFPELGKLEKDDKRSVVISKQTTLFYRIIDEDTIELMLFWNNLWDTKKLEYLLK